MVGLTRTPQGSDIDGSLPKQPPSRNHFRALPYSEVGEALHLIEASTASLPAKLALRFLVFTAARSSEVRGATWSEIDWQAKTWTIPAHRMKQDIEHRVPLSTQALQVLERAREINTGTELIFPSAQTKSEQMSDMTFLQVLRRVGLAERCTPHGFRSSFRSWAAEQTSASWAACELALAHRPGNAVEKVYLRVDLLGERRGLMQAWANFLLPA